MGCNDGLSLPVPTRQRKEECFADAQIRGCVKGVRKRLILAMAKIDFKKTLAPLYNPKNTSEWEIVDVPALSYLALDGEGDPNVSAEYQQAVETLYAVAYAVKFASKREYDRDYVVPPLEGLWDIAGFGGEDESAWGLPFDKSALRWTMLIMLPDWIAQERVSAVIEQVRLKKNPPALPQLSVTTLHEGRSAQLLHIGRYDDEAPKLRHLHTVFLAEHGLRLHGRHHEIYLGDPRRTPPEKLKTVIRQPVAVR